MLYPINHKDNKEGEMANKKIKGVDEKPMFSFKY
jgi:hypothetical protein